ncbi:AAEL013976-PA [Aedes aegypti]|uniref:AAEL013976-PA n=2 Tax=Aedes aegypti TaxID=7159 RepID=Q16HM3_AEDAE|nr:AAEL013976-PA [Aedes aegypti]
MAFEFSKTGDTVYSNTFPGITKRDSIYVTPKDYGKIPITISHWKPEPCFWDAGFQPVAQSIKDLEVRPDDVWLIAYPKSGITWCQEMIWLVCNNLDYEKAASLKIDHRWCYLDLCTKMKHEEPLPMVSAPSPRFIKSHLPVALLPDRIWSVKPKIVYVRRNPKSVAVSYYHHYVSIYGCTATKEQFMRAFLSDQILSSPYHQHVIEYHHLDYPDNLLYLCYEDMKKDLKGTLRRVCSFFGKSYSDDQFDTLTQHLSFDSLKNNKAVNFSDVTQQALQHSNRADKLADPNFKFMRRGEVEGWKRELDPETIKEFENWTNSKVLDPEDRKLFD